DWQNDTEEKPEQEKPVKAHAAQAVFQPLIMFDFPVGDEGIILTSCFLNAAGVHTATTAREHPLHKVRAQDNRLPPAFGTDRAAQQKLGLYAHHKNVALFELPCIGADPFICFFQSG